MPDHIHLLSQSGAPGTHGEHYFDPATRAIYHLVVDGTGPLSERRYRGFLHQPGERTRTRILTTLATAGLIGEGPHYIALDGRVLSMPG